MAPRAPRQRDRERREDGELCRKGLGRGDADLGAGQGRQYDIGLAGDRALRLVDDRDDLLRLRLRVAQSGKRVGGLARLRHEDRRAAARHRRRPVAELRGDVDLDRDAGDPFEPVFGDDAGVVGGAACDHRDPLELA